MPQLFLSSTMRTHTYIHTYIHNIQWVFSPSRQPSANANRVVLILLSFPLRARPCHIDTCTCLLACSVFMLCHPLQPHATHKVLRLIDSTYIHTCIHAAPTYLSSYLLSYPQPIAIPVMSLTEHCTSSLLRKHNNTTLSPNQLYIGPGKDPF